MLRLEYHFVCVADRFFVYTLVVSECVIGDCWLKKMERMRIGKGLYIGFGELKFDCSRGI